MSSLRLRVCHAVVGMQRNVSISPSVTSSSVIVSFLHLLLRLHLFLRSISSPEAVRSAERIGSSLSFSDENCFRIEFASLPALYEKATLSLGACLEVGSAEEVLTSFFSVFLVKFLSIFFIALFFKLYGLMSSVSRANWIPNCPGYLRKLPNSLSLSIVYSRIGGELRIKPLNCIEFLSNLLIQEKQK